jgi:hypothetical protein
MVATLPDGATRTAPARRERTLVLLVAQAALGYLGFGVASSRLDDNSFLWHLRTGHRILEGGIPRHDPFSFTAMGERWIAQSWLAEVLYGALDAIAGPAAIRAMCGLVGAAIAVSLVRLAARLVGDRLRGTLLAAAALLGTIPVWSERPLLLGLGLLVVVVWVVEVPGSWVGRHPVPVLAATLWLWVNVHGSFSLGVVYLGLHLVGRWLDGDRPTVGRQRQILTGAIVGGAVSLVNPYGFSLLWFPVALLDRGDILAHVYEWQSPAFRSAHGLAFALWLLVTIGALARGPVRPSRRDVLVACAFLLLGFWARRNLLLVPVVTLPVVARAWALPALQSFGRRSGTEGGDSDGDESDGAAGQLAAIDAGQPGSSRRPAPVVLGALVVAGVLALVSVVASLADDAFDLETYPVDSLEALEDRGLLGRHLLTDDAWAGWVIYEYDDRQPVFVDDRYDMYPLAVLEDFLTVNGARPGWDEVLERWDVETVVWPVGHPLVELLEHDGWQVVHEDDLAITLVRADLA